MSREGALKRNAAPSIPSIFASKPDHSLNADLSPIYSKGSDSDVEERSYRTLLPVVKQLVQLYKAHPELEKNSEFRIACAVCCDLVQFRGWEPLLIHAQKYWKRFPLQHHAYHRALTEAFKVERFNPQPTDPVAWPPVLLVENGGLTFDGSLRRWKGLQGVEVPENIKDLEIEEVLAVYKRGNGHDRDVVVFPASEVGLVDGKKLTDVLERSPKSDDWVKLRVENVRSPEKGRDRGYTSERGNDFGQSNGKDADDEEGDDVDLEDEPSISESDVDYDKHHPLGTWATLKEIRETDRVDSVMRKWAKSFAEGRDYCAFAYKWPFQKSKKLREMDIKFQEDLQRYSAIGAAGNEKLRVQLDEIEKQLRKEKLLWLKDINEVREQFKGLEKDFKKEEAEKALDKKIWEMRIERDIAAEMEELEEQIQRKSQLQLGSSSLKKRRQVEESFDYCFGFCSCEWGATNLVALF